MGVSYVGVSIASTVLSFLGVRWWIITSIEELKLGGFLLEENDGKQLAHRLLKSYVTVGLVAISVLNVYTLLILCLKVIFFGKLQPSETWKVLERVGNYVVYKGAFLPLILPSTIFQAATWSTWLILLCTLKMFQAMARDRLEQLNASPSATPWAYFRVFSVLLLVLSIDFVWIRVCVTIFGSLRSTMFLLLFFEPFCIAFETLQAIMVHGFQLLDIWHRQYVENSIDCQASQIFDRSAAGSLWGWKEILFKNAGSLWEWKGILLRILFRNAGSLWEWKGILLRNVGFFLDVMTLLMATAHHMHIWWLHGMGFHLVDVVIFLHTRALLSAIIKRIKGFFKLRKALGTLHGALPDATSEELQAYDDECAICREPMAKAKKLSCNHLFHLACLRSWLDQGLSDTYSCPTCRRPLFVSRPVNNSSSSTGEIPVDEQLARQINSTLDDQNPPTLGLPIGALPNHTRTSSDTIPWRVRLDSSWSQGLDDAGPSNATRSVGLGRVQMMMRHLASVGETYAQSALEDAAWSLWPLQPPQSVPSTSAPTAAAAAAPPPPPSTLRYTASTGGLHFRNVAPSVDENIPNILSMVETIREVLPHIPDEMIFQDLQRTNSVTVTLNNFLQM